MPWLKQNLFLVISALVGLGLLGGSGYYLYLQIQKEKEIDAQWQERLAERDRLIQKNPTQEKIEFIKEEEKRVEELAGQFYKFFVPIPAPVVTNNFQFKTNLDSTLAELERAAEHAKVTLRDRESFGFSAIKEEVGFEASSLQPLANQLAEIKAICEILFHSKVHSLDDLRRVAVTKQDQTGTGDYLPNKKIETNAAVVVSPYQVTFRGFTPDLAAVLNNFVTAPHCFVVKSVNVESSVPVETGAGTTIPFYSAPMFSAQPGYDEMMRRRYGLDSPTPAPGGMSDVMRQRYGGVYGGRYGGPAEGATPAITPFTVAPFGRASATNLVDEKTLRATLAIEVIRLRPPSEKTIPSDPAVTVSPVIP